MCDDEVAALVVDNGAFSLAVHIISVLKIWIVIEKKCISFSSLCNSKIIG